MYICYQTVCSFFFPLITYIYIFFFIVCVHIFSLLSAGPGPVVPQVSQYLYFLFAPTLIYRDKYPRCCVLFSLVEYRTLGFLGGGGCSNLLSSAVKYYF